MFDMAATTDVGTLATFAVGLAGLVVGVLWLRRMTRGEPDPQSFRASASRPTDHLPATGIVMVGGLVGLVLLLLATR
jgi:hypothetical protein